MSTLIEEAAQLGQRMAALSPSGPPSADIVVRASDGIRDAPASLVVLDASFNPMTLAHEQMIAAARAALPTDEVLLLLSSANVDKQVFGAGLGERLAMLKAYAADFCSVSVGGCSHARFVEKARALQEVYPHGTALHFIIGYDTLLRLFNPIYYTDMSRQLNDLFARASFLVANRGNAGPDAIQAQLNESVCVPYREKVATIHLNAHEAAMSSTQAREAINQGQSAKHLVPARVADGIQTLGLYRNQT